MSTTQGPERPPYVDELRDVAKRISPAFPDASSTLSAIADRLAVHPDQDPRLAAIETLLSSEGELFNVVAQAIWSAPRNGTSWDVAKARTRATVDELRAALAAGPNQTGTNA